MKTKSLMMAVGVVLVVLSGCARDRTIEDYRDDQVKQVEAQVAAVGGDYRGMYVSRADGTPIGGLTIHVEPDRSSFGASNAPEAEQQAVLKLTAMLDDGTKVVNMTFNGGAFDPGAQQFAASNTVTNRGTAELTGTFNGDTLTGVLEAEGYPDRGGTFTLSRNAPATSVKQMRTRAAIENQFLFNSFSGQANFQSNPMNSNGAPSNSGAPDTVNMVILKQTSVQDQDFMDIITPYRYVDISVYQTWKDDLGNIQDEGVIFQSSVWDIRAHTLAGIYSSSATNVQQGTELKLSCNQITSGSQTGWSCTQVAMNTAAGTIFTANFLPVAGGGTLQ